MTLPLSFFDYSFLPIVIFPFIPTDREKDLFHNLNFKILEKYGNTRLLLTHNLEIYPHASDKCCP